MSLAPLRMSVPASDGLILKGVLTYPPGAVGGSYPLAVLAHQYPATRDSYAPLTEDLLAAGVATLAFDQRGHGDSIVSPRGPVVVDTPEGVSLEAFGAAFVSSVAKVGFPRIENDVVRVTSWGVVWSENAFESLDHALRLFVDESGWVLRQQQALDGPHAYELIFEARREDFSRPSTQQILEDVGLTPQDVAKLLNRVEPEGNG